MIEGSTEFGREPLRAYPEEKGAPVLVRTNERIEGRVEVLEQGADWAESRAYEAGTYAIECLSHRRWGEETVTVWRRPLVEGARP